MSKRQRSFPDKNKYLNAFQWPTRHAEQEMRADPVATLRHPLCRSLKTSCIFSLTTRKSHLSNSIDVALQLLHIIYK
ncbi:hypothetical protein NC653_007713 [Populus alba x Populus x berolinensis]|uniref:Uncharacterized protein n=1 Tax=Populus alba x Populus x berolinensis TaxID=444605 RepID=A0AAD6RHK2_9ROSI|nr:hypothetical protein NC653_007713 [Populus alba x Populus x berolinensis]